MEWSSVAEDLSKTAVFRHGQPISSEKSLAEKAEDRDPRKTRHRRMPPNGGGPLLAVLRRAESVGLAQAVSQIARELNSVHLTFSAWVRSE